MSQPIRVLLIEDSESDAALVVRALEKARYSVKWRRVDAGEAMRQALSAQPWDLIICDYSMPQFDAPSALSLLQASGLDIPFIVVSGTVGEELAVAMMRAGAHDYLMKGNLARLGPAVARELIDALNRRHGREADDALRASEDRWKFAIEATGDGVWDWNCLAGTFLFSQRWKSMLGHAENELGESMNEWFDRVHPDDLDRITAALRAHLDGRSPAYAEEHRMRCRDGSYKWVLSRGLVISRDPRGTPIRVIGTNSDITQRKEAEAVKERHERTIRELAETQTAILDALPANIALIGPNGVIRAVNESWTRFSDAGHLQSPRYAVGTDYLGVCDRAEGDGAEQASAAAKGIRAVLRGELPEFTVEYPCHSPEEQRWFCMSVTPLHVDRLAGAVVKHINITDQKHAEERRLQNERMKRSLALAMQVQQSLLPASDPVISKLDIAGRSKYCDSTGGDYYDFIDVSEGDRKQLFIAVGDVAGHGIAAALLMATARGVVRANRAHVSRLSTLMQSINTVLSEDTRHKKFMTLLLAAVDPDAGVLRWSSAGHDAPFVYHPDTGQFEDLDGSDLVLGIETDVVYTEHVYGGLRPGDMIFIGTDGIWEMRGPDGSMYGKARLRRFLRDHHKQRAADVADALEVELANFMQGVPSQDDVTYVVIKIENPTNKT